MKQLDIEEANAPLRKYAGAIRREPLVITRRGKPVVAMVPLRGVDMESLSLSSNSEFMALLEKSRQSIRRGEGIPAAEMRRRFGVPPKKAK